MRFGLTLGVNALQILFYITFPLRDMNSAVPPLLCDVNSAFPPPLRDVHCVFTDTSL